MCEQKVALDVLQHGRRHFEIDTSGLLSIWHALV